MNENDILKLLLARTNHGYWDWDIKENKSFLSEEFLAIFGYTKEDPFPENNGIEYLHKIINAEDYKISQELFKAHVHSKAAIPYEVEERYMHRDGSVLYTKCFAQVIEWDNNNEPVRMVGCHQNITDQKNREEALIKERDVLKLILNDIPQSIFWRDKDHKYLGCNIPFAKSLRVASPDLVVGKTNYDFIHLNKDEIEMFHNEDNEVLYKGYPRLHFTGQIDNNEGKRIWVDSSKVPLKDANGNPYAVLGIFSDITEHESIKEDLSRTNKLYNTLSRVNEILLNVSSKEELFTNTCKILTEIGGFQLVWVGEMEGDSIVAKAIAGQPVKYIQNLKLSTEKDFVGYGPTSKSIIEGNKYICNDFFADILTHPWRENANKSGIKASANFPVKLKDKIVGSLTVYADTINYFQNKEVLLLEEVAHAISFGLEKLNRDTEKKIAEKKIKQLADIIEYSSTFVAISTPDGKDVYKNNSFKKALAIEGEDVTQFHFNDFHTPKAKEIVLSVINDVMEKGISTFENELISKNGQIIPVLQTIMLHKNENNQPEFLSTTAIDITDLKNKEEELSNLASELRSLSNHLISIREEERKSIAQEIHDELGQNLAILKMDAVWIRNHIDGAKEKLQERLQQFNDVTDETVKTSRRLYNNIYPQMLDDVGLLGAIRWHSKQYYSNKNFKINIITDQNEAQFFPDNFNISLTIFRIYQECLTNILRHADATIVNLYLDMNKDNAYLKIEDNGKGFQINKVDTNFHHGLLGMRERVYALNGTLTINSAIYKGTTTIVTIPIIDAE